jgi:hypothetical protein
MEREAFYFINHYLSFVGEYMTFQGQILPSPNGEGLGVRSKIYPLTFYILLLCLK